MKKIAHKQKTIFTLLRFCGKSLLKSSALPCLLIVIFLLFGCRTHTEEQPPNVSAREITDDLGKSVKIPEKIERAVSLAPNLTEIAFAVGAGDKLVGVTTYCDYPLEAREISKIGDTINPNIENIIALKPQIVLVSTASQIEAFTRQLEAQNVAVFVTNPNSLEDIYKSIEKIGLIFNREAESRKIVADLQTRVAAVEAKTKAAEKTKVFVQISKESLYTIGKDSFLTDLIRRAGGASLTSDLPTAYPKISLETASALNPEAIILSESEDNLEPNEVFRNSPARRDGKVFRIAADLLSRPGPRAVDGLEQAAKALHPENFR